MFKLKNWEYAFIYVCTQEIPQETKNVYYVPKKD